MPSRTSYAQLEALGVPNLHVWRRGVSLDLFDPARRDRALHQQWSGSDRDVVVGYVGRIAAEKEVRRLVGLAQVPGIRLVIVGDGPERGWLQERLPDATFTGMLGGDELARAFASLDVFVHPGTSETFCQTVQEAQASGVPVVAAAAGGPLDLVDPGETGLLFDPRDPASLIDAVATFAADGFLRDRVARTALRIRRHPHLDARRARARERPLRATGRAQQRPAGGRMSVRIAQLANFVGPASGGMKTAVERLGRGYVEAGAQRLLVIPGPRDQRTETEYGDVVQVRAPQVGGGYRLIVEPWRVIDVLEQFAPTSLEISDKSTLLPVARWARKNGVATILFSHERLDAMLSLRTGRQSGIAASVGVINRVLVRQFDRVVVTSRFAMREFRQVAAAAGTAVHRVPLGVDLATFRPPEERAARSDVLRLVHVGRLSARRVRTWPSPPPSTCTGAAYPCGSTCTAPARTATSSRRSRPTRR